MTKSLVADDQKFKLFKEQTSELFAGLEEEQTAREVITPFF